MIVEIKKIKPDAEKNGTLMNVIYILLIFSGTGGIWVYVYKHMYV